MDTINSAPVSSSDRNSSRASEAGRQASIISTAGVDREIGDESELKNTDTDLDNLLSADDLVSEAVLKLLQEARDLYASWGTNQALVCGFSS